MLSLSVAVEPGPTSSLTRHMSLAAVIGCGESTATSGVPFAMARTATTVVSASGLKAVLMLSSQASGPANWSKVPQADSRDAPANSAPRHAIFMNSPDGTVILDGPVRF